MKLLASHPAAFFVLVGMSPALFALGLYEVVYQPVVFCGSCITAAAAYLLYRRVS